MQISKFFQRLATVRQPWTFAWAGVHSQAQSKNTSPSINVEYINNIAVAHMNYGPENYFNGEFVKEMNSVLDAVEGNKSCYGFATIGNSQFYSNGFDHPWLASLSPNELVEYIHKFKGLLKRLLLFPMPTLAILSGDTYAAGAFLAFAQDIRTMNTEKAHLSFTAVRKNRRVSGFIRDYLNIQLGGGKNVADALILSRKYTAQDAHSNLLVHATAKEEALLDYSLQILESFLIPGPYPREAILNMKKDVFKVPIDSFELDLALKVPYFAIQYMTPEQLAKYKP